MLKDGERIDQLFRENMSIIQSKSVFSFSVDALLLAEFTKLRRNRETIVDLCSGNGIIPLLLSAKTPHHIKGVELQPTLVDMANRSIQLNNKAHQIEMIQDNINHVNDYFSHSTCDVITVNPPYFTADQPLKEKSAHSIARHEIHTNLEAVVTSSKYLIKNKGRLYMVHRAERSAEVIHALMKHNFRIKTLQYVYNSPESTEALFVLVEAIFNSKVYVKVMPNFFIYDSIGNYSKEMMKVYYG